VKATFEARVADRSLYPLFDDIASLMSHVEHRLYVDLYVHHRDANEVKREALVAYGVTSRQFNGVARVISRNSDASNYIGVADASNVVLADRYRTTTVLTLDQRHFRRLRPLWGADNFTLLPYNS